ncbi:helix-turn-helix domain-containing protein [Clostridium sp. YIM B02515]|uniref:Helix-turn-helix domain-containing protein n=1 Tax=Clostridium rhizosphaerae TaxID=2803861 RepID=A0ABS1T5D2_9CLOT|nr:helix-turn-helix domain-containing protein [Clostridium rhizosphaerae]MBL4934535.1 helix-turn-helix domain-containing protein [Clostridium rhizosphaerae]
MEGKFYNIDQVAEILGMHHKTIRKFIAEGKLGASKVGKQWRISSQDLNAFMEQKVSADNKQVEADEEIKISANETNSRVIRPKINVSTVIEVNELGKEQYMRISNTLIAVMNSKDPSLGNSTINMKYNEREDRLKIMLWGTMKFTEEMLSIISLLTDCLNEGGKS